MLKSFAKLVVIEHSVFALPFALSAFILAVRKGVIAEYNQPLINVLLVVLAIVLARTAAMAFNRFLDADIDAVNPRTADREIPRGVVSRLQALLLTGGCSLGFVATSYFIGWHCFVLAPLVIGLLLAYSYTKRFTVFSHFVLGLCLAAAPGGAWWVVRPEFETTPIVLMLAVLFWVAGFDILYSCQDAEFDRQQELRSLPAKIGIRRSLRIAQLCHFIAALLFVVVGKVGGLGGYYTAGILPFVSLLFSQHVNLTESNIGVKINRTFFMLNGAASIYYLGLILLIEQ